MFLNSSKDSSVGGQFTGGTSCPTCCSRFLAPVAATAATAEYAVHADPAASVELLRLLLQPADSIPPAAAPAPAAPAEHAVHAKHAPHAAAAASVELLPLLLQPADSDLLQEERPPTTGKPPGEGGGVQSKAGGEQSKACGAQSKGDEEECTAWRALEVSTWCFPGASLVAVEG